MVDDPALIAVGGLLAAHNVLIDRLPARAYVPACLATTGALVLLSPKADLGFTVSRASVATASVGAATAAGAVALAARVPAIRPLFHDQRLSGPVVYQAFVRIPFGTVVLEEVAFRGVLLASLGPAVSSLLFGLWHIVPTRIALDVNGVVSRRTRAAALVTCVAATAAAGLGLCWLRRSTASLLVPAAVHAAATSSAAVAAHAIIRRARANPLGSAGAPAPSGSSRRSRPRGRRGTPAHR